MESGEAPGWGKGPVVVLGGINMDIQGRSLAAFKRGDSNPGTVSTSPGGVGRNIAENLVRLGFEVEFVGVLGDDGFSRELESSCEALGIGLSHSLRVSGPASLYLCLLGDDGKLAGAVSSMAAMELLTPDELAGRKSLLDGASCLVVDTNVPEATIGWVAERYRNRARQERPLLILDPVSGAKAPRALPHLDAFDIAKPNLGEARTLSGLSYEVDPAVLGAGLRKLGLRELYLSLGADGIYFEGEGPAGLEKGRFALPFPALEDFPLRNVSGAGDAACAGIVRAAADGLGTESRARFALAASIIATASESTVNPAMSRELLASIAARL